VRPLVVLLDASISRSVAPNDTIAFTGLDVGSMHTLELIGVSSVCSVVLGENPRTVHATMDTTLTVHEVFEVRCPCSQTFGAGIFFSRDALGETPGGIYRMDPDGGNQTRLTTGRHDWAYPSSDGRLLAHERTSTTCSGNYCSSWSYFTIEDACGGKVADERGGVVEWSPDGRRILFMSGPEGPHVMNADGSDRLSLNEVTSHATWSPDGSRIAFASDDGYIYVIQPDGSGMVNLTNDPARQESPDWSPDGTLITYAVVGDSTFVDVAGGLWIFYGDIWVMGPDGSSRVCLVCDDTDERLPVWSPDGSMLAFRRDDRFGADTTVRGLYVVHADGSSPTMVTTPTAYYFAWSPDGTRIAFSRQDVFVINADGTGERQLTSHPAEEKVFAWAGGG
jgi:TolB protein